MTEHDRSSWTIPIRDAFKDIDLDFLDDGAKLNPTVSSSASSTEVAPSRLWSSEEVELNGATRIAIANETTTLYYRKVDTADELTFRAELPDFFLPGNRGPGFSQLQDFLFQKLPQFTGNGIVSKTEGLGRYMNTAVIKFKHSGLQKDKVYDFGRTGSYYDFVTDFSSLHNQSPESLRVIAKRSVGWAQFRTDYDFHITYGFLNRGDVSLLLPENPGERWTPELVHWALSCHADERRFTQDDAKQVATILHGISKGLT